MSVELTITVSHPRIKLAKLANCIILGLADAVKVRAKVILDTAILAENVEFSWKKV
jgi:hypothetical protein